MPEFVQLLHKFLLIALHYHKGFAGAGCHTRLPPDVAVRGCHKGLP